MRSVVTGGGTLDRKSSSVGGGFAFDNVDSRASCGGGRAIEEFNEDEWSAGRYLSVMKWSNTAIHARLNDAVGCKGHKTNYESTKRGRQSHEHGKVSKSMPIRRKDTSLDTFEHSEVAQELAESTAS